ncbi:MAG: hypothetical protein V1729_05160 [Candidatus Woesearchaeota archaeon]
MRKAVLIAPLIFLVISVVLISIFSNLVSADVLPGGYDSATLNFFVEYDNETITPAFRADILICLQGNCDKIDNSGQCAEGQCSFSYYRVERVPHEMKLQVTLYDKTFTSDTFRFSEQMSVDEYYYLVDIKPDGNMIISDNESEIKQYKKDQGIDTDLAKSESDNPSLLLFVYAVILTIVLELAVLIFFIKRWKVKAWTKPILTVIAVNMISIPLVWTLFLGLIIISFFFAIIIAEAFAVVFEAYVIHWMNKKQLKLKQSFILSFIMNLVSFLLGGAILVSIGNAIL